MATTAFAQESKFSKEIYNKSNDITITYIGDTIIKDISFEDVPKGITPVQISKKEYEDMCQNFKNGTIYGISGNFQAIQSAYTSETGVGSVSSKHYISPVTTISLVTTYTYETYEFIGPLQPGETNRRITTANSSAYLGGYTIGMELETGASSHSISTDGKSCDVIVTGVVKTYLILQGGIKIASSPFTTGHTVKV